MPCCHVGLAGPFANQFTSDAQRFSAYVGGAASLPTGALGSELVSALHVDLKLWQPAKVPIGRPYRINDAFGNAWKAARPQRSPDPFKGHPADRAFIESLVLTLPPPPAGCVLSVFDQWILDTIEAIRDRSVNLAGGGAPAQPYALSTIGMAQKILNLFLKYQACWHVGGQWDQAPGQFVNHPASATVAPFLCALHSPIDSRLLNALLGSPIGQELVKLGWMNNQGYLQQANGVFTSWSNLDCLKTYFRFQLMLRKIAMRTWPPGCACQSAANHGNNSAAASNLPPEIFEPGEVWDSLGRLGDVWSDDKKEPKLEVMKKITKTHINQSYQTPKIIRELVAKAGNFALQPNSLHFKNGQRLSVIMFDENGHYVLNCESNSYSSLTSKDLRFKKWFSNKRVGNSYFISVGSTGELLFN